MKHTSSIFMILVAGICWTGYYFQELVSLLAGQGWRSSEMPHLLDLEFLMILLLSAFVMFHKVKDLVVELVAILFFSFCLR